MVLGSGGVGWRGGEEKGGYRGVEGEESGGEERKGGMEGRNGGVGWRGGMEGWDGGVPYCTCGHRHRKSALGVGYCKNQFIIPE